LSIYQPQPPNLQAVAVNIDTEFVTRTLRDLVRINSVNPTLVSGAPGESEIADYVAHVLRGLGLEVGVVASTPGRPSVVGRLRGRGRGRSLMLNAHQDTVGVDGMAEPFSGAVRDGRMYGRGTFDMKGGLAASIGAAKALIDANAVPAGDVIVAAVADEEHSSLGMQDVLAQYRVDGAIVTEATALDLCVAHKGFIWVEIETLGRAAHGSRPELGVDANLRMGRVLARLEQLEQALQRRAPHALLGPPSVHAATLQGGTGLSTYAASCKLGIERRTIPGETAAQVEEEMRQLIEPLQAADPTFHATARTLLVRDWFETPSESVLATAVERGVQTCMRRPPRRVGQTWWMDSAFLGAAGTDTVVIGPEGAGAHADEEWVDLSTVHNLTRILAETATLYCGSAT
jgi:acetylornithine deacetylase